MRASVGSGVGCARPPGSDGSLSLGAGIALRALLAMDHITAELPKTPASRFANRDQPERWDRAAVDFLARVDTARHR